MSFFDFNPYSYFVSGDSQGDFGIDQTTKTTLDQMSKSILDMLGIMINKNTGYMATLRNGLISSFGKTKNSMVLSLNNGSNSAGSAGASAGVAASGAIAGIVAAINSLSAEIEQITYTGGGYIADTIGKTEYITHRLGQTVEEFYNAGGKASDLTKLYNPGRDEIFYGKEVLTELGKGMQKAIEAEAGAIFGGVAELSTITGAGLGAILASVLTIPGDTEQITQDQVDAAMAQYQLEQSQEIQENMGNLEAETESLVDNTNEFMLSDSFEAMSLISGIITGTTQNLQSSLVGLVNKFLAGAGGPLGKDTGGGADPGDLGFLNFFAGGFGGLF
jgi:hypothetical protein